ncbi:MAG: ROK family protein [Planctomycetota bacterium]
MGPSEPIRSIGIDIGGSSVKAAALTECGAWRTAQSERYRSPDPATLRSAVLKCLRELRVSDVDQSSMGLCVPGRRDAQGYTIVESVNVPALTGVDLRALVDHPNPMVIGDAEAAAVDAQELRGDRGRLLLLALGTGVGACVLDGGTALRVSDASPGHFGQIDVSLEEDAPIGPDNGRGSLEAYIGAAALITRFGEDEDSIRAGLVADDRPLRALSRAIRVAHAVYRPRVVCLAGGVGLMLRDHLPELDRLVRSELTSVARQDWVLECADDLFHAARGAARSAEM